MEKINVAIRVRPPSDASSPVPFLKGQKWNVGPQNISLYSGLGTPVKGQSYSFDHVFGTEAKNVDIYDGVAKGVIMSSLDGFNGTVFAYGQTSSGKTYTMKGTPTDPGIIPLAVNEVFCHIRRMTNNREFLIRVSYMEIYNEEINDLFAAENRRLRIQDNLEKGNFVAGLGEEIVDSPEQVFNLLEFGESHRHLGETNMNLHSSRSHTIFRMVIESRDASQHGGEASVSPDAVRVSCLNMVDLAGSERIAKTGAGGVRLKEGTHINKSLMTLGTVINKLSDGTGKQGAHIPYRDSKLTRILQPALGGNAKTAMICTVTPDEIHIDETRGTLQFASRAKRVSTCAQVNEIVTDAALLKRQTKEIEDLRMKLQLTSWSGDEDHSTEALRAGTALRERTDWTDEDSPAGEILSDSFGVTKPQTSVNSESNVRQKCKRLTFPNDQSGVRELQIKLTNSELEIVELKSELEGLRVEMQGCGDIIQNEKGKCGNYYGTRARKVLYWSSFIFLLVWSTGAVSGDGIPRIFTNIAPPS